jgi:hypothetical protein
MALMMSFLHDDAFAAWPWSVIFTMCRLAGSFGLLCLFLAGLITIGGATFALALALRPHFFWLYFLTCLGCWIVAQWIMIVVMRILGLYYRAHKDSLVWHAKRPRWGDAWRL